MTETFLIISGNERDAVKNIFWFLFEILLILVRFFFKLGFSILVLVKYSNTKFHENPSSGGRVVPCGKTDRHDETNSRIWQFCERTQKLNFVLINPKYISSFSIQKFPSGRGFKYV